MIRSTSTLPEGYIEHFSIDLQKDKKTAVFVNVFATVIAVIMVIAMSFAVPIGIILDTSQGLDIFLLRCIAVIVGSIAYLILHEAVHGIAMKICGTKKIKYGFTGLYAFAGSDDYYSKKPYIFIALAPIVLWGVVLLIVNLLVPIQWFWVVYFIQVMNISGAAGDIYVSVKFSKLPKDMLVRDSGTSMTVYIKE